MSDNVNLDVFVLHVTLKAGLEGSLLSLDEETSPTTLAMFRDALRYVDTVLGAIWEGLSEPERVAVQALTDQITAEMKGRIPRWWTPS